MLNSIIETKYTWQNTDMRMQTAFNFYKNNPHGKYLIYKTTRAGCTTALVAGSLNLHERFLIVVPTNAIADKTVIVDAEKYSDRENTNVVKIPANHKCLINEDLCRQYPDLSKLPILPLAQKCIDCDGYNDCPVTEILRYGDVCDGVSITYHKLVAILMAATNANATTANEIIEKIRLIHNTVFDEVHELQYGRTVSLTYYNQAKKNPVIDLNTYMSIVDDFPNIRKAIVNFSMLLQEIKDDNHFFIMYNNADSKDYFKHKLSKTIMNNYCNLGNGREEDNTKVQMAIYQEIINLTKKRDEYNLEMDKIIQIYDIMGLITSEKIVIHGIKDRGVIKINMVAVDDFFNKMIGSYIKSIQTKSKRILLTSATICSHNYDKYFMNGVKPENVLFGNNGDPMNTNSKMLIIADSKKYHVAGRNSLKRKREEIANNIIKIMDSYGDDNCMIVATNKKDAYTLSNILKEFNRPHYVTWYKANDTIGVSSSSRICIAVGAAHKPSNAYDAITETKQDSLVLREESMHCDTWQAWSRVKDPSGKDESIVFALGVTEEECKNIVKWGFNRNVEIQDYDQNKREKKIVNVECIDNNISIPTTVKCNSFDSMLEKALFFKQSKNLVTSKMPKYLLYNNIRYMVKREVTIYSESDLIRLLCYRDDYYAEQTREGKYFKVSGKITDQLLQNHIDGKITIGAYTLNPENKVRWLCFDVDAHLNDDDTEEMIKSKQFKADEEKNILCGFFDGCDVPYLLEASGTPHSYHVWVFLKPVEAIKARELGKAILKECGIKKMEVFPKQTRITKNGYGNLVKLPFATHRKNGNKSKIWLNGEWVTEFNEIVVGAIDISSFSLPEIKKCESQTPVKTDGIRLIFTWALSQTLTDEEGHWMRIAVTREYYNNGIKNPDELAELFKMQHDYDFEISKKHVLSIIKDDVGCWKWSTLVDKCPNLVRKYNNGVKE